MWKLSELAIVCLLEVGDGDQLHLEHGVPYTTVSFRIGITHQLAPLASTDPQNPFPQMSTTSISSLASVDRHQGR